jgi:hypothetical protein
VGVGEKGEGETGELDASRFRSSVSFARALVDGGGRSRKLRRNQARTKRGVKHTAEIDSEI